MTSLVASTLHAIRDELVSKQCRDQDELMLGIKVEIEGICINLIENAIKYTTPGTPIRVKWTQNSRDEYVFSVEDQGPGIDAAEIPRITDRYYRGARSRAETAGSGLGLAIVKHATNKHGGKFTIESEPGKGSRFSVTFPTYRCLHAQPGSARVFKLAD